MRNILVCFYLIGSVSAETLPNQYERVKNELLHINADAPLSKSIVNVDLKRNVGLFTLSSGTLYVLSPVNGAYHSMYFEGEGNFTCTPPTDIERKQLFRSYGKETLDENIKSIFFLYTDSTLSELKGTVPFTQAETNRDLRNNIKSCIRYIEDENKNIDIDIFREFITEKSDKFFYAEITTTSGNTYFFEVDPFSFEDITLQRPAKYTAWPVREVVCKFSSPVHSVPTPYCRIHSYMCDNTIDNGLHFSSACSVSVTNNIPSAQWMPFYIFPLLRIDSVIMGSQHLVCEQDEESGYCWIGNSAVFPVNDPVTLSFYYHGTIIDEQEGWYTLKNSIGWYPQSIDERQYTTFDITFHTPSRLQFVCVGKKIAAESVDNTVNSRWVLPTPARNVSFLLGSFTEYSTTSDSLPPIDLYMAKAHDASLRNYLGSQMILSGKDMDKQVTWDIENSIRFFEHVYGKKNIERFSAAEIPDYHGESFPGFIDLSWATFQNTERDGSDEVFRAHEVAHQWWGAGVDYKSYHDQWLSEAFAEYSGLWYMQIALHNNEKFFDMLDRYKKLILSNRKYLFGSGQEAGPIWLGYRTQGSSTRGDYDLIIYRKGAWVLHMLRNMAIDLNTMNERIFMETMQDFYNTYNGKQATTENFKTIVEKHFGMDMSWFFDEYVYGTDIPTYNILYKSQELPGGKYKIHCIVKQTNVPDSFQMVVPFFIDFGQQRYARIRHLIKGPVTEFDFTVPIKPEEIKFNDLHSVLCDIDDEDWD